MAESRRKNELIFGKKAGDLLQINSWWGIEAAETVGSYKNNLVSVISQEEYGTNWYEFAISYDNKIFLRYPSRNTQFENCPFDFDHQTMGCGTFLKA